MENDAHAAGKQDLMALVRSCDTARDLLKKAELNKGLTLELYSILQVGSLCPGHAMQHGCPHNTSWCSQRCKSYCTELLRLNAIERVFSEPDAFRGLVFELRSLINEMHVPPGNPSVQKAKLKEALEALDARKVRARAAVG